MPLAEMILLGVIQGATEFLPVSSDGHLALAQMLFGVEEASLTVTVLLHAGTLLATFIVLRKPVAAMLVVLGRAVLRPSIIWHTPAGRDLLFVVVASVPTAIIGLASERLVERLTTSPLAVSLGFFVTGALLIASRWAENGMDDRPSIAGSVIIGILQGIAVLPGVSRSGSTIAAALWLGVRRERAFELSMVLSLPAVSGAVALELRHGLVLSESGPLLLLGIAISFLVGIVALYLLRHAVARGYFPWFALWVIPVACATLALAWAWPARN